MSTSPNDWKARYQLAAMQLGSTDLENAMAQLLEIAQRGRCFHNDIGRRGPGASFDMPGTEHPLIARYRSLLVSALFWGGGLMQNRKDDEAKSFLLAPSKRLGC